MRLPSEREGGDHTGEQGEAPDAGEREGHRERGQRRAGMPRHSEEAARVAVGGVAGGGGCFIFGGGGGGPQNCGIESGRCGATVCMDSGPGTSMILFDYTHRCQRGRTADREPANRGFEALQRSVTKLICCTISNRFAS